MTLPISGMSCTACAQSVENIAKSANGVKNASVNYASKSIFLEFNPKESSLKDLKKSVQNIRYDLYIEQSKEELLKDEAAEFKNLKRRLIISSILTLPDYFQYCP